MITSPAKLRRLADQIYYHIESGNLYWKQYKRGRRRSRLAGCTSKEGHITIKFERENIQATHLIWYIVHGEIPPDEIDHIDHNPSNNRMNNLRLSRDTYNDLIILIEVDGVLQHA